MTEPSDLDEFVQTQLCTLTIPSLDLAHGLIGVKTPDGRTPLTLQPRRNVWSWYMNVPEGFYAMLYRAGEYIGIIDPGFHILSPMHKIQYLVTKQWTVFDAPVKQCPTKDDVKVDINTVIVFRVHPDMVKQFVVSVGAETLTSLFLDAMEEAVRILARKHHLRDIYSLSGSKAEGFVDRLNERFRNQGVEIKNVTITGVRIPKTHAERLESVSWFPTINREQEERTAYSKMKMDHEKELTEKRDSLNNEQVVTTERLHVDRYTTEQEVNKLMNQTNSEVAQLKAQLNADLSELRARNKANLESLEAEKRKVTQTTQSEIYKITQETNATIAKERSEVDATAEYEVNTLQAERQGFHRSSVAQTTFKERELEAKALQLEADAEKTISKCVKARRAHELELKRLDVLEFIVRNPRLLVAGDNGVLSKDDGVASAGPMLEMQKGALYERMMMESYKSLSRSLSSKGASALSDRALMESLSVASGTAKR